MKHQINRAMDRKKEFEEKYGSSEVKLHHSILTIHDCRSDPFSSGSNGYLKKVRIKNGKFEFYHDWWAYEWLTEDEVQDKYPDAYCQVIREVNSLL